VTTQTAPTAAGQHVHATIDTFQTINPNGYGPSATAPIGTQQVTSDDLHTAGTGSVARYADQHLRRLIEAAGQTVTRVVQPHGENRVTAYGDRGARFQAVITY
jgi:hypothetical protein